MGRTSDARERLVQAAIDLIWQSSYGAVGVDAICAQAGVKKGSFYHFFSSKDELVVAALAHHWDARRPVFDAIFSPSLPPLERLRRYLDYLSERQHEVRRQYGRVLGCFHNSIGTECVGQPPDVAAKVQEVIGSQRRYLETTLRDARAEGFGCGDPVEGARALFALAQGALGQARIHDDPAILRSLTETGFALLGLGPVPRAPGPLASSRLPTTPFDRRGGPPPARRAARACERGRANFA